MKDKEVIAIGCVVGLCAQISSTCNTVRWLLSQLHSMFAGSVEEAVAQGASWGRQHPKHQPWEGQGKKRSWAIIKESRPARSNNIYSWNNIWFGSMWTSTNRQRGSLSKEIHTTASVVCMLEDGVLTVTLSKETESPRKAQVDTGGLIPTLSLTWIKCTYVDRIGWRAR